MFGPFEWAKSGPHKCELTEPYHKIKLRRALPIYKTQFRSKMNRSFPYPTLSTQVFSNHIDVAEPTKQLY